MSGTASLASSVLAAFLLSTGQSTAPNEEQTAPDERMVPWGPSIDLVQERALLHAQLQEGRLEGLRTGAAWKAVLPVVEVSGGYTESKLDESTILDEYSASVPWVVRGAGGNAFEARAKLQWDLSRVAYNGEELDVLQLQSVREHVIERVTELYYLRRRLVTELRLAPSPDVVARREKLLRIEEATALLSGLTGGWYGESVKAR